MKYVSKWLIVVLFLIMGTPVSLAMQSSNYQINWDSLNSGGEDSSSSANYSAEDTLGQLLSGASSSSTYSSQAGYRLPGDGTEPYLMFDVAAQKNSTEITYTTFNNIGLTVTVTNASDYASDDYIVVTENIGASQMIAIGKIVSITTNDITVDAWEGDNSAMSSSPSGSDDFVYKLEDLMLELGLLELNGVNTGTSFVNVSTNASNGYTVQFNEDTNLQVSSTIDIDDVSDASVTAGEEEYGIEIVGQDAQGSGDQAITSTPQNLSLDSIAVDNRRTGVIYKAAVNQETVAGNYSHTVTFTCTGNF